MRPVTRNTPRDMRIVKLFNAGATYSAIAEQMTNEGGAVTKGVVAGAIARYRHLVTRPKGLDARTGKIARVGVRKGKPLPPKPQTVLSIERLTTTTCRWPYGEGDNTTFCGEKCAAGVPYCDDHMEVAFQRGSSWTERDRTFMSSRLTGAFR